MATDLNPSLAAGGNTVMTTSNKIVFPGETYSTLPTPPDSQVNSMTVKQVGSGLTAVNVEVDPTNGTTDPTTLSGN